MKEFLKMIIVIVISLVVAWFFVSVITSCATARSNNKDWQGPQCQTLLDQRDSLVWATAFGSGLSGVGGITTAIVRDNEKAQLGIGISTAVIGAVTSSLIVLSKIKSSEFEQYCNTVEDKSEGKPDNNSDGGI
jgi:hypothetical protein